MTEQGRILEELNDRSREVFRRVVEGYLNTGTPVGSRTLTRSLTEQVSAATVRNVMQDLEFLGLLGSPHASAGRVPTQLGLRLFVDGFLEVGDLDQDDRQSLRPVARLELRRYPGGAGPRGIGPVCRDARGEPCFSRPSTRHRSSISTSSRFSADQALVVLVFSDGHVENRIFNPPEGTTPSAMREAANFLNARLAGQTVSSLRHAMAQEIETRRREIDALANSLIENGLAVWDNAGQQTERLIVRGRSHLLSDSAEAEELDRIRMLFDDLERKRDIAEFLELTEAGDGVRIFIGSENKLFSLSGSSLVVSPYMNADRKIVGAVGVIGPTRLNYGRIVPIVDYTAQLVGRMISDRS